MASFPKSPYRLHEVYGTIFALFGTDFRCARIVILVGFLPLGVWQTFEVFVPRPLGDWSLWASNFVVSFLSFAFIVVFFRYVARKFNVRVPERLSWIVCGLWAFASAAIASMDKVLFLYFPGLTWSSFIINTGLAYIDIAMNISLCMYLDGNGSPVKNLVKSFHLINSEWKKFLIASLSTFGLIFVLTYVTIILTDNLNSKQILGNALSISLVFLLPILWSLFPLIYLKLWHFPDAIETRLNIKV